MNTQSILAFPSFKPNAGSIKAVPYSAKEYKVICLRDCPLPDDMACCDTPDKAADYWRAHVIAHPYYNPAVETLVVLLVNTRRKILGHHIVATGTLDTVLAHSREIFRTAIVANSSAIVLMHNHPSGDPAPSEGDIKITRDIIRAGQLLKIELLDHVVMGNPAHMSLKSLGYFH